MRVTKQVLEQEVFALNTLLNRPTEMFAKNGAGRHPIRWNTGHLCLDKNTTGYQLEEVATCAGATHHVSHRMKAGELFDYLTGMRRGILMETGK